MAEPKRKFAEKTTVPESKSRQDIESVLERFGIDEYATRKTTDQASVAFRKDGVSFMVTIPLCADPAENRRRWRSLYMLVKSNVVAVDDEIVTLREAFMPYIVTVGGGTLYQALAPKIDKAAEEGRMLALPGVVG